MALMLQVAKGTALAQTETPANIDFKQNLNAQVPLDANFIDETGQPVTLAQLSNGKPLVVVFAYYTCTMLCDIVLPNIAKGLSQIPFKAGVDFQMVTISIDPTDTPQIAAKKKADILSANPVEGSDTGWRFLVGQTEQINRVADVVGFKYFYIPETKEYAHPTGLVVLTPTGRVSHYLYGIDFLQTDLRLALVQASANKIGSPVDSFFLFCFHYDPKTGRYTPFVENLLKVAGGLTVLVGGAFIFGMVRKEKKGVPPSGGGGDSGMGEAPPRPYKEDGDKKEAEE